MQRAALILSAIVALAPLTNAETNPAISFLAPAQVGTHVHSSSAAWIFISFEPNADNQLSVEFPQPVLYDNITEVTPVRGQGSLVDGTGPAFPANSPRTISGFSAEARFPSEVASLYIEGDSIAFNVTTTEGNLVEQKECVYDLMDTKERNRRDARSMVLCPPNGVGAVFRPGNGSMEFTISGHGLRLVEWHHASVTCNPKAECPGGGVRDERTISAGSQSVIFAVHGYNRMESSDAKAVGAGNAGLVAVGGPFLDLAIDGWVRLPLARQESACSDCAAPANQTFFAEGDLLLRDLSTGPDGTMSAVLEGNIHSARFDEAAIDPGLFTGPAAIAAAAAAGVTAVLVKFLLWPLFTRNRDDDLLTNDRRRKLYDFVVKNPGVHFREVLRATGIPAGAGRYHVNRLVAEGLLTERRQRSSLRLFENHKRFHDTWQDWAALRDPKLRQLHDWLVLHPDSKQKDLLDAFRAMHGWAPTTTQRRLERLVRDGVAEARTSGRGKFYSATKASVDLMASGIPAKVAVSA